MAKAKSLGGQGRIPDSKREEHIPYIRVNVSFPFDLFTRLEKYCADDERARSWAIQQSVDSWLEGKGY